MGSHLVKRGSVLLAGGVWTLSLGVAATCLLPATAWSMPLVLLACAAGWGGLLVLCQSAASAPDQPAASGDTLDNTAPLPMLLVDSATHLRPQLSAIRNESDQVLGLLGHAIEQLAEGFHGMHRQTEIQRQLALTVMASAVGTPAPATDDPAFVQRQRQQHDRALAELTASAAEVDALVSAAVKGLQVNDLVSQLIGHVLQRVDAIDIVIDHLNALALLCAKAPPAGVPDKHQENIRVDAQVRLVQASLQAMVVATERPPVAQQSMSEGEIELF